MWRHSRWYESDWMIHTIIESAQQNSHISAWKYSHTAVKKTDWGYWGECWWYETHSSANKAFLKGDKNESFIIIYSPPCHYKMIGFSSFNRKKKSEFLRSQHAGLFPIAFIITSTVKLQIKRQMNDLKKRPFDLCVCSSDVKKRAPFSHYSLIINQWTVYSRSSANESLKQRR